MQHYKPADFYLIGSDESGKGDSFGGICVSAVLIEKKQLINLENLQVTDSKKLSDHTVKLLAKSIQTTVMDHHTITLDPKQYNDLTKSLKNTNLLLTNLHCQLYQKLLEKNQLLRQTVTISIDQFANQELFVNYLNKLTNFTDKTMLLPDQFLINGETKSLVIAAASILARDSFINQLQLLNQKVNYDLPKGSSHGIEQALLFLNQQRGFSQIEQFKQVAKLNFKNVTKFLQQLVY